MVRTRIFLLIQGAFSVLCLGIFGGILNVSSLYVYGDGMMSDGNGASNSDSKNGGDSQESKDGDSKDGDSKDSKDNKDSKDSKGNSNDDSNSKACEVGGSQVQVDENCNPIDKIKSKDNNKDDGNSNKINKNDDSNKKDENGKQGDNKKSSSNGDNSDNKQTITKAATTSDDLQVIINATVGGDIFKTGTPQIDKSDPYITKIAYPDGREVWRFDDGEIIIYSPPRPDLMEGRSYIQLVPTKGGYIKSEYDARDDYPVKVTMPNGTVTIGPIDGIHYTVKPDGTMSAKLGTEGGWASISSQPDGSSVTNKPDGTVITKLPDGKQVTKKPDGSTLMENTDGTWDITFRAKPDGSQKIYFSDGREGLKSPDGKIIFP